MIREDENCIYYIPRIHKSFFMCGNSCSKDVLVEFGFSLKMFSCIANLPDTNKVSEFVSILAIAFEDQSIFSVILRLFCHDYLYPE